MKQTKSTDARVSHVREPALLDVRAAAQYLGLSKSLLDQFRSRGRDGPPWVAYTPRAIRYRVADLDEWVAARVRTSIDRTARRKINGSHSRNGGTRPRVRVRPEVL